MSVGARKNRLKNLFLGGFALVIGVAAFISMWIVFIGPSAELGQQQAVPLIAALEEYYDDQGRYPDTAARLIPTYLSRIPDSGWGKPLVYIPCSDGQDYTLDFHRSNGLSNSYWGYTNRLGSWICAGAAPPFYQNSPCGGRTPQPSRFPC